MHERASEERFGTSEKQYAERLAHNQLVWWKRVLPVQAPYRYNLRRLRPGFTLDVGCGIGRNLINLYGNGVGVDHNPHSVEIARARGFVAFTEDEFRASEYACANRFDSLLFSHVAEHMDEVTFRTVAESYLGHLRAEGRVIVITPQEVGQRSDPTHVQFFDFDAIERAMTPLGLVREKAYSFPFPRPVGNLFIYNEFVWVGRREEARG